VERRARLHSTPIESPFSCYVSAYNLQWEVNDIDDEPPTPGYEWYWVTSVKERHCASFIEHTPDLSCKRHLDAREKAAQRREDRLWTALTTLGAAGVGGLFTLIAVAIAQRGG